jgi:hypothetical protein
MQTKLKNDYGLYNNPGGKTQPLGLVLILDEGKHVFFGFTTRLQL